MRERCACGKSHGDTGDDNDDNAPAVSGSITITDARGITVSFTVPHHFAHCLAIALADSSLAESFGSSRGIRAVSRASGVALPGGGDVPGKLGSRGH